MIAAGVELLGVGVEEEGVGLQQLDLVEVGEEELMRMGDQQVEVEIQ